MRNYSKAIGAGIGGAVSILLVWAVGFIGIEDVPEHVQAALAVVITAFCTYIAPANVEPEKKRYVK